MLYVFMISESVGVRLNINAKIYHTEHMLHTQVNSDEQIKIAVFISVSCRLPALLSTHEIVEALIKVTLLLCKKIISTYHQIVCRDNFKVNAELCVFNWEAFYQRTLKPKDFFKTYGWRKTAKTSGCKE